MKTELYIENYLLDQSNDVPSLLTFSLDDIKDFSTRTTTFSKTIILPGTDNNNRILGNIFQIGNSNEYDPALPNVNYNFNAAKSANAIAFQDNIQTFKGVLRLLEIDNFNGRYEYQVAVFGDISGLNGALGALLLEDLDFSSYDHTYSEANIVNSWDNTPGSGYYYPLMDCGTYSVDKHNWDYHTFRPGLYVKEYIDKMIGNAGFSYESDLFNTSRFKGLIVPYNHKILTKLVTGGTQIYKATDPQIALGSGTNVDWQTVVGSGFTASASPALAGNVTFTFAGATTTNIDISGAILGLFSSPGSGNSKTIKITKNGVLVFSNTSTSFSFFSLNFFYSSSFNTGDTVRFDIDGPSSFSFQPGSAATFTTSTGSSSQIPINLGDSIPANEMIPKNIKQIDFLVSIVKLFNLYVYEDRFEKNKLYLTPYIDFYGTDNTASLDWSYKLNRNKTIKVKPMSEITSKVYNFKYKSDTDYYSDLYAKRYNQGYGDYIYSSDFDFTTDKNDLQLIFSSTVLVGYVSEDKVYPTIFKRTGDDAAPVEETVDSNIRILQTKKIDPVSSWNLMDGASILSTYTKYGYAGHLDDPDAPTNDLNFGAPYELFFILATGFLSANQFNLYWSSYMAEITNKDSKLLTGNFKLNPQDVLDLDFSKFIYLDGVLFRLQKIQDYDLNNPSDPVCSLIKVNYTLY